MMAIGQYLLIVLTVGWIGDALILSQSDDMNFPSNLGGAVSDVFASIPEPKCFPLIIGRHTHTTILYKEMIELHKSRGVGVLQIPDNGQKDANTTHLNLSYIIKQARLVRQVSRCVVIVLVSQDKKLIYDFGKMSLNGRLMIWSTHFILLTQLPTNDIIQIMSSHWTFSMYKTIALNFEQSTQGESFHGALINVTAKSFTPYWLKSQEGNNTIYSGMDYQQLVAISEALNFTFNVLPSINWDKVTSQVMSRESFMATQGYAIIYSRLKRWDYTCVVDYTPYVFALAKPVPRPSWLSSYYPLGHLVWIAVLITTIIICFILIKITKSHMWINQNGRISSGVVVLEALGCLLGQGLYGRVSTSRNNHILMACWLIFGVLVSTSYRSSLISSLTSPIIPPRPETIEELVESTERFTMESFGTTRKNSLITSGTKSVRKLGQLLEVGTDVQEGLTEALTKKHAHMGNELFLRMKIAKHFSQSDGSIPIYIGREDVSITILAWVIPHDAPYKPALDKNLMAIAEGGLYKYWHQEVLDEAAREGRMKKRKEMKAKQADGKQQQIDLSSTNNVKSLTFTHILSPLLINALGIALATIAFIFEVIQYNRNFKLKV